LTAVRVSPFSFSFFFYCSFSLAQEDGRLIGTAGYLPQEFTTSTVPALGSLEGRPVRADWVLDVQQRAGSTGKGFVRDWWLDFASDNCLHFQGILYMSFII
jgi:hypothetical protein